VAHPQLHAQEGSLRKAASLPAAAAVVALAAVNPLADFLQGQADYFSTLGLPQWLVQWGE